MKKKIMAMVAVVTLAVTSAMANTEIDLNYYITPVIQRSINYDGGRKVTTTVPSFVGLEGNFNWFFGSNAGIFDAGLNLDTGIHAITGKGKMEYFLDGKSIGTDESTDPLGGVGIFLSLGPVLRFTFTDIFSLSLTPGLQFGFDIAGRETTADISGTKIKGGAGFLDFSVAASINAAMKLWLVNTTGFHLGLNIGADVDFPFAGVTGNFNWTGDDTPTVHLTGEEGTTYGGGMNFRIFAGIAFQFGDRAYDR